MVLALQRMREAGQIKTIPVLDYVAATSVGVVGGMPMLDLAYEEDSRADVDMNIVKTGDGRFIEVQGTAEGAALRAPGARRPDGARRQGHPGARRRSSGRSSAAMPPGDRHARVTKLVVATTNPGKVREINGILATPALAGARVRSTSSR